MQTTEKNRINYSAKAVRQLKKLNDSKALKDKIKELENPQPGWTNVRSLTGHKFGYRQKVQIGSRKYRVLFDFDSFIKIVKIQEIKKRDDNTY